MVVRGGGRGGFSYSGGGGGGLEKGVFKSFTL